jgi:hypothetical protein
MNTNSQHSEIGKNFEIAVKKWFEDKYKKHFANNISFNIGNPAKPHRFDVVSEDKLIVAECKCITWTETGNIPQAKITSVNEAVFYLSFITNANTYIILKKSEHLKRTETLAEYYHRINQHLLGNTNVLEYDNENGIMKKIGNT